jgi:hypothetical protein
MLQRYWDRPRSFKSSNLRNGQRYRDQTSIWCSRLRVDLPVDFCVDSLDGLFLANFRKLPKILCRKRTQKLQIVISQRCSVGFLHFFRQSLVLVGRYRNVAFDLPESNTKNDTVEGILKIGVTFWSNSAFYGEKLVTCRQSSSRELFQQVWRRNLGRLIRRIFENTGSSMSETGFR